MQKIKSLAMKIIALLMFISIVALSGVVIIVILKSQQEGVDPLTYFNKNLNLVVPDINEIIILIIRIVILIALIFIAIKIYRLVIKIYEKKNYRYFVVAPYPEDYQQEESEFYNKNVNLLHRMHGAIKRPYYSKIIFGKMKFAMYVICNDDNQIAIYYGVHKNRSAVFETFFKQQFLSSDLFEVQLITKSMMFGKPTKRRGADEQQGDSQELESLQLPRYKHYRKLFSHLPLTFFDDKQEMTRELFTNISENSALMIEVHAEHQNSLRYQIKRFSRDKARSEGVKDKSEIDGVYQNQKAELKKRITDKEVVFNVNIVAASDAMYKFAFAHDVATATRGHNELKVYRWPLYIGLVQRVPSAFYSKTYMTDKELSVVMRFPHEEAQE